MHVCIGTDRLLPLKCHRRIQTVRCCLQQQVKLSRARSTCSNVQDCMLRADMHCWPLLCLPTGVHLVTD